MIAVGLALLLVACALGALLLDLRAVSPLAALAALALTIAALGVALLR
ncbi:hypothetical protein ACWIG4_06345 [Streptomyces sp. NPDC002248]